MVLLVQRGSAEEAGAVGQTQNLHHAAIAVEAVKQHNPKLTGERMNEVNEASPANKVSDVERVVSRNNWREQ